MLTNNFWKCIQSMYARKKVSTMDFVGTDGNVFNGASGNYRAIFTWIADVPKVVTVKTSTGICFGDSDEAASADDYWLKGNIISGFTYTVATIWDADGQGHLLFTITNTSNAAFTIKEVVWTSSVTSYWNGASSSWGGTAMLDRTVLDTPVTIPAGGVGQVEYTITFNLPTAAADAGETE